ncbi:MAG: hypothetical protein KGQ52_07060 [Alphaproteobacteria bacterium]|nr:hypothetical protein [Alphaproteobacteria bacterium]
MAETLQELPDTRPFDAQLGYDVPRLWTTGAQIFGNVDHFLIVFREQTAGLDSSGQMVALIRNVSSVAMPVAAAKELHKALGQVLDSMKDA